ncbi:hypothetical protein [Chryseobacterium cheonjiense]|uniref:DUF3887 domain-containing protein n=1 Tax=Chryseobacterium cheonjiense TaxID=2728845 RepID=A0A7Y0A8T5_9FLAO|nr:hypothetical protein [Chryseobacterium cheonjiense]NML58561.1 hypothetical protein [Chryseobacterium cheonjiense]
MKKILLAILGNFFFLSNSQKLYSKIDHAEINPTRLSIGKSFIETFLDKCYKNNSTTLKNFKVDKRIEKSMISNFEKECQKNKENYGNIEILELNSAYKNKRLKSFDPVDLFIFNIKTEKVSPAKFLSVWVYEDSNVIGGIWISKKKPLE